MTRLTEQDFEAAQSDQESSGEALAIAVCVTWTVALVVLFVVAVKVLT